MTPTKLTIMGASLLGFVLVANGGDTKGFDASKVLGGWTYVEGTRNGEMIPKDHLKGVVKFEKDKLIVPGEGEDVFVMAYKIDGAKSPAAIDIKIEKSPIREAVGSTAVGIIAVDGDMMKLAYVEGKDRPTSFQSTEKNKVHSFVLKRAQ